jgi:GT2 family glycosyltransferase/glycosyltransferase involved in cell wall biosynthesis
MPSPASTLAPPLLAGTDRTAEGAPAPRKASAPERRAAVAERPLFPGLAPAAGALDEGAAEPAGGAAIADDAATGAARAAPAKVHALIIHHRGIEMLGECLASLLGSQRVELEIVVVLNHCLEDVPEIAKSSPRVHLLELDVSRGFGEANNLGVAFARRKLGQPDYYYFVNNDTLSRPDTLSFLVGELAAAPAAAIAGPQTLIQSAPNYINSMGLNVTEDAWAWDEGIGIALCDYGPMPAVRPVAAVTGSAVLMKVDAFEKIGGWTEIYDYYFEDIDLGIKTWRHGFEVLHVPAAVIFHRVSATMDIPEKKYAFFWRNRLILSGIHWPLGMLLSVLKRAIYKEVIDKPWRETRVQRKALLGALRKLPYILRERWRHQRGHDDWRRFLYPPGSVPRITLPKPGEVPAAMLPPRGELSPGEVAPPELAAKSTEISPLPLSTGQSAGEDPATPEPAAPRGSVLDEALLSRLREQRPANREGRRLLVFGWSPLPFENQRMNYAPGTRSWQFASALAADGHAVALVTTPIPGATFEPPPPAELEERQGVLIVRLDLEAMEDAAERSRLAAAFAPDAVIGATPGPSGWAKDSAGELPLWVDFFGDPLAEGQAREAVYPDLETYGAYAGQTAPLLRRGDAFSAVSARQRLALIGQLGLAGRLRGSAAGHEFVGVLPCAAEPPAAAAAEAEKTAEPGFLVFWSGGFNTWCDVPTLVEGLELAMDRMPDLRFVATGGEIAGHDDLTAAELRRRVAESRHGSRFELLGQVAREAADDWQGRAHLALITEKKLYERELGSSGRISGWLAAGKAILCSSCSELATELAERGLILTYPAGDAAALAARLVEAAKSPERLRELAARAAAYARENLSYADTTRPLRAWARDPRRAPESSDPRASGAFLVQEEVRALEGKLNEQQLHIAGLEGTNSELASHAESLDARREELESEKARLERELEASRVAFHGLRGELGAIHQSKMWRLWMSYQGFRRGLLRLVGLAKSE